jgi:ammonium transporter, Amt family
MKIVFAFLAASGAALADNADALKTSTASGWSHFAVNFDNSVADGQWGFTFCLFQIVLAVTAATIVSGALAERTKFAGYLLCSVAISAFI